MPSFVSNGDRIIENVYEGRGLEFIRQIPVLEKMMSNHIPMAAMLMCLCFASVALGQNEAPMNVEEQSQPTIQPGDPSLPSGSTEDPQQEPHTDGGGARMDKGPSSLAQLPLLLVLVAVVFFMIWTAKRRPVSGIAGWLLLPAIGLALSPVIAVIAIIVNFMAIVDLQALPTTPDILRYEDVLHAGIVRNVLLGLFALYAATRFFRKKENAPRIVIWLLLANVVLSVLMMWEFGEIFAKSFIIAVIQAAIWVPYFLISKRVKATFGQTISRGQP